MASVVMLIIAGCQNDTVVFVKRPTKLLEQPYPYGYPSTNPQRNIIIATLKAGDAGYLLNCIYGKDYRACKVRMTDGAIGYLIDEGDFEILKRK
ncbi:hypothetical protein [uncultured Thiodictyon sp.]|uniref:hypothetical protein n=1 Tax=uncultured Thiodictyon sp. TaxID=1846217 RepID=UPI002600C2B7|nr:hypothetical protein [uncultured Thiodictyon sp.]